MEIFFFYSLLLFFIFEEEVDYMRGCLVVDLVKEI